MRRRVHAQREGWRDLKRGWVEDGAVNVTFGALNLTPYMMRGPVQDGSETVGFVRLRN